VRTRWHHGSDRSGVLPQVPGRTWSACSAQAMWRGTTAAALPRWAYSSANAKILLLLRVPTGKAARALRSWPCMNPSMKASLRVTSGSLRIPRIAAPKRLRYERSLSLHEADARCRGLVGRLDILGYTSEQPFEGHVRCGARTAQAPAASVNCSGHQVRPHGGCT
jgi:hypothetical protein